MARGRSWTCALWMVGMATLTGVVHGESSGRPVFRYTDVDKAWDAAQESQRPILVFISSSGCPFCHRMLDETYHDPRVADRVRDAFEAVSIVQEQQPDLVTRLRIRRLPTTLVVSPQGKLLARIEGFADPRQFSARIQAAMTAQVETHRTAAATTIR